MPALCTAPTLPVLQLRKEALALFAAGTCSWRRPAQALQILWGRMSEGQGILCPANRHVSPPPLTPAIHTALCAMAPSARALGASLQSRLVELNFTGSMPGAQRQPTHTDICPTQDAWPLPGLHPSRAPLWTLPYLKPPAHSPPPQDVTADMGPTEFAAGSHHMARSIIEQDPVLCEKPVAQQAYFLCTAADGELDSSAEQANDARDRMFVEMAGAGVVPRQVCVEAGDVVAMDCRVHHRGGANASTEARVLLNATFQEPSEGGSFPAISGFTYHHSLGNVHDPQTAQGHSLESFCAATSGPGSIGAP
eukprot:gene8398-1500_t